MLFSAVYACPKCLLRFERRARCPECGDSQVASLVSAADRAAFRRWVRAAHPESGSPAIDELLLRVGDWAPTKPWIPLAFGALMMFPLFVYLAGGKDSFLDTWMGTDHEGHFAVWREGLSATGVQVIVFGIAGALVASLAFLPGLASRAGQRRAGAHARRNLRVFAPGIASRGETKRTTLEGTVRLATAECTSPLGETPCVVFGLTGAVAGCAIDDADGGDFDVELESGERVFVSLEHAVLEVERAMEPEGGSITTELDDFCDARGVGSSRTECSLDEIVLCDGDAVRVEGVLSGTAAVAVAYRQGSGSRVLSGDEHAPLVIFPTKRRRALTS